MDRCGDPHYAYLPIIVTPDHLAPFTLWTAFPSSLVGRYSYDYYEASVTIRTRVPQAIPCSSLLYASSGT